MKFKFRSDVDPTRLDTKKLKTTVLVGYFADSDHYSGMNAAELGKKLSEGDHDNGVPPRPHLYEGLDYGLDQLKPVIAKYYSDLFKDHTYDPGIVAEAARQSVIDYIYSGNLAPNAPYTIQKKLSDQPLVDTGALIHLLEARVVKGII